MILTVEDEHFRKYLKTYVLH